MIPHLEDTIVALSSAPGSGERGIVRLTGPKARSIVDSIFQSPRPWKRGEVQSGVLSLTNAHTPLPCSLYFFPSPHTYTGQDLAEIHTISSPPLLDRLIADLLNAGARSAMPGEFTMRAFLAGKKDLTQAEAVLGVIEARSDDDLKQSLTQLAGGLTTPLRALREDLLNLLADIEAALDFVDEDIEFVSHNDSLRRVAVAIAHLTNIRRQFDQRATSDRVVRVVLVGEPNSGKSSLFNALIGESSAIVSPMAGTTRDYLVHRLEIEGVTIELVDTAGVQLETNSIESQAQTFRAEQQNQSEIILWCVPVNKSLSEPPLGDVVLIRTKSDLISPRTASAGGGDFTVSITNAEQLNEIKLALVQRIVQITRPALAPSHSRCRHHVDTAIDRLREMHNHLVFQEPPELQAFALRSALQSIGEMTGAVYTNDLLDRIFSRFCIGK